MTKRRGALALWIVPLAATILVILFLVGRNTTEPTRQVAMPARDAAPEQVVRSYLDAQNAGDITTMNALVVGDEMRHSQSDRRWIVSDVKIHQVTPDNSIGTLAENWRQSVRVDVSFHTQRSPDMSIPEDEDMVWGYWLVRQSDSEAWRLVSQGM